MSAFSKIEGVALVKFVCLLAFACSFHLRSSSPRIFQRSDWGARNSKVTLTNMVLPVSRVFIHHTAGSSCYSPDACKRVVKGIQNYHMDSRGWWDIGYSFLVGLDGNIYVGRGFDKVGAHTKGHNSEGIAISTMGNFMSVSPNEASIAAVKHLIAEGKEKGYLTNKIEIWGHRDMGTTACPGDKYYNIIKTWPEYGSRKIE